jgi:predicted XRE-type DNA-binding protein
MTLAEAEFHDWDDVRAELLPLVGGEEAIAKAREELRGWVRAYKLAEARKRRRLSQREVAKAMGVTQGRVSQIEHGDVGVAEVDTLARYIEALGGRLRIVADFGDDLMQIA